MGNRKAIKVPNSPSDYFMEKYPELQNYEKPFGLRKYIFHRVWYGIAHATGFYYLFYLIPFGYISRWALLTTIISGGITGLGITVGSHRYWTHKSFKANKPLQILLMILHTSVFQDTIFRWCRLHRTHHKFTDTDGDPSNSKKGFLFSHLTWTVQRFPPEVGRALKSVDVRDLAEDPIIRFQAKYYYLLNFLFFFLIPMGGLKLLYPEWTFLTIFSANCMRFLLSLHGTFLVNSVAHLEMFGYKPYDKNMSGVENRIAGFFSNGEGWHNFHHTFPWDYATSEHGLQNISLSTAFINFFAMIGWAYDLKTVSHKMLVDRINRTGDESHPLFDKRGKLGRDESRNSTSWGFGDKDSPKEDMDITETLFQKSRKL